VTGPEDELPETCDALLVNDAVAAFTLAERYASAPQVFVAHGEGFMFCTPPQLPGVTSAVVALNDRVASRLRALAVHPKLVRLRQPIDITRFADSGGPRRHARRVLLLGSYLIGERRDVLTEACERAGLEWTQVGAHGTPTPEPELAIAGADIVVGHGRSILEAMSSGRPAYVYDHSGADGWVTPERYAAMEADGFAGQRDDGGPVDAERLCRDLQAYRPEMGRRNRDLVQRFHRAGAHAQELVALFGRLPARTPASGPLDEMARLAAAEWRALSRAERLRSENRTLRTQLHELEDHVNFLKGTRRYRTMALLVRPLDALRRLARR
jgi:hypothetical protein